jgi:hypothetical protein
VNESFEFRQMTQQFLLRHPVKVLARRGADSFVGDIPVDSA